MSGKLLRILISMFALKAYFLVIAVQVIPSVLYGGQMEWKIRPEMRLPPVAIEDLRGQKVINRFDFTLPTDKKWQSNHSDVSVMHDAVSGKDSRGSLRIHGIEPSGWKFASSPKMLVKKGVKYRARLWARIESVAKGARPLYFKVEFVGVNARETSNKLPPSVVGKWSLLEVEFSPPEGCNEIWIGIEKGTDEPVSIDASIDEFILEEIKDKNSLSSDSESPDLDKISSLCSSNSSSRNSGAHN